MSSVPLFRFPSLSKLPGVEHAISTRHGGVSRGRCATLNTSYTVDDDPHNVDENLDRLAGALGATRQALFSAHQVHGRKSVVVRGDSVDRPRCDILLTNRPERALMLRYADCTPVLLVDPVHQAIAVVHAGWRGSALRAASAAVRALTRAFDSQPADLVAGIGPAIGPCCYTVGEDVRIAFADRPWALIRPWDGSQTRLDLWEANRQDLVESGVRAERIEMADDCTQCRSAEYFSHRANAGQPAGRFAAVIRIAPH